MYYLLQFINRIRRLSTGFISKIKFANKIRETEVILSNEFKEFNLSVNVLQNIILKMISDTNC